MTADTRALMVALHYNDHAYLAVRPTDATPAEAPGIVLGGSTANDLSYAMITAGQHWPDCTAWDLIGSDEQMTLHVKGWPPTMHAFRKPLVLASFATA